MEESSIMYCGFPMAGDIFDIRAQSIERSGPDLLQIDQS